MPVCVFPNCDSGSRKKGIQSNPNVHLHRFPKNEDIRNKWLMQIGSNIDGKCIHLDSGINYKVSINLQSYNNNIFSCSMFTSFCTISFRKAFNTKNVKLFTTSW